METPLIRANVGTALRIGIRAGDVLLATLRPEGLSARNVISGKIVSLACRDVIIAVVLISVLKWRCISRWAARDALHLAAGREVWPGRKDSLCHLMAG